MNLFDPIAAEGGRERIPIPKSELDFVLTAQLVVAWAGEGGEEKRLGWWPTDLVAEFAGEDLLRRLLPHTWEWAVLQGVREAARRTDAEMRSRDHNPDRILSLYNLGFENDERVEERFQDLKRSGLTPQAALPHLADGIQPTWNRQRFEEWLAGFGAAETTPTPAGRRIAGEPPSVLSQQVRRLVAALAPLGANYPLPYFYRKPL
jgi:hypothetical protein